MRRETKGVTAELGLAGFSSCAPDGPDQTVPASALFKRLRRGIHVMRLLLSRQGKAAATGWCADGIPQPLAVQATGPTTIPLGHPAARQSVFDPAHRSYGRVYAPARSISAEVRPPARSM